MKIGKKFIPPLALLMILIAGIVYAQVIGPQAAPRIPAKGANSNCSALTPSIDAVAIGGPAGTIAFDCSVNVFNSPSATFGTSAFSVAGPTTLRVTISSFAGPYTSLWI